MCHFGMRFQWIVKLAALENVYATIHRLSLLKLSFFCFGEVLEKEIDVMLLLSAFIQVPMMYMRKKELDLYLTRRVSGGEV